MCYQDVFSVFGLIRSGGEQVVGILVYQSTLLRGAVDRDLSGQRTETQFATLTRKRN